MKQTLRDKKKEFLYYKWSEVDKNKHIDEGDKQVIKSWMDVIYRGLEQLDKQFIKDLMDLWGYSYDGSISIMGDDIIRLAGNKLIEEKEE